MDMDLGWFADPLFLGDYPDTVKRTVGADLPALSDADKARIRGSLDFLGINYYTGKWVVANGTALGYNVTDVLPDPSAPGGQRFIGPLAESFWLRVVPWSFRKLLAYVHERYGAPEIFITENGVSVPKENDLTNEGELGLIFRRGFFGCWLSWGKGRFFWGWFFSPPPGRRFSSPRALTPPRPRGARDENKPQRRSRTRSASTTTRGT